MDKKDLHEIVNNMVKEIVEQHEIPEPMARGLVGFALLKNRQALLASVKSPVGAVSAN